MSSRTKEFPSKAMRRGVQAARAAKASMKRLAVIHEAMRQGVIVRNYFRKRQLVKREVRAELRKAA